MATIRQDPRMRTHVALLRGINVGGRNRIAMADLRAVVTSLAHTEVATYIQSAGRPAGEGRWPARFDRVRRRAQLGHRSRTVAEEIEIPVPGLA
jgi:hypothetical protein